MLSVACSYLQYMYNKTITMMWLFPDLILPLLGLFGSGLFSRHRMATTASIPPYMMPGVAVQQPSHLEGDANLATEILPGPPSITSVQQAAQKRDPRKPSTVFSYLPPSDPGSTYSGIMHGTLIGQEPQDGPRTKRSRVDKGTASGRAQRASARNQNGATPAVPLESTSSAEAPAQLLPTPSPVEPDNLPGAPEDEPSLSRSNSSLNLYDLSVPTSHGRTKRKDKGKAKEVDSASVKVKEEPKSVLLPSPDPQPASNLQPPAKPPPSLLSPLIHQLNISIPVEFQLPEDIRTYFKDVGQGPKGNYIDTTVYKPPRQNRLGLLEDRDPYRLKDRNGAPVLCFQCGMSALPNGLAATAPASKRTRRSLVPKGASNDSWKPILSCDFCSLYWHLDCLDPPLPSMPPYNKKWMCPNHSDKVLVWPVFLPVSNRQADNVFPVQPIKRRIPKSNPYPVIEIDRPGQFNNGNIDIIPSETTTPIQQVNRVATDEVLINGRRYRVPERTIVLDFWSKLNKAHVPLQQEEKDTISSAMSSPLTSLSSLDDFGDDPHEAGPFEGTDELKIAEVPSSRQFFYPRNMLTRIPLHIQMLCNLRLGKLHTSNPRRKTTERAVQTSPDTEAPIRSGGRSANPVTHAKRLTKAATVNGFTRPQPSASTDSTSPLATSVSAVITTRRKRSAQSTQPENSARGLRSRSRNIAQEPSKDNANFTETTPTDTTAVEAPIPIAPPPKKAVQVKVEESDDPLALLNGISAVNPSTTVVTKTPSKRRGRRPAVKDTEESKPAPAKRGRKRKEREDDPTYRPNNTESSKKEKLDPEEKEKRVTRRRNARTPSRSRVPPPNSATMTAPTSTPTTPSLKIRLPRFNAGSISATNSGGAGSPSKS
ncbi:hypothetical protein D9756_001766 [Leucocoprinus leucothites]|uniref:Zinc finger PHD-type domain-containing protein n=1 Tax=Leucocoprinus leucothites TaxID=201217 RepID=A0A8H5G458_9AGAR|nr:hypothetical protein D9756_001766 [Leucoagaricus leucothites]